MRNGTLRRAAIGVAVLAGLVAGLAVTAGWLWLRTSIRDLGGSARLPGLDSSVTVYLDDFAIPHLFARSEEDVFRAQGWIHASERLWQLEMLRRTARGELSEIFGDSALRVDRLVRTLDLWGAAREGVEALSDDARRLLEAYAAGVNARIRDWPGPLPPEFLLLGIRPGEWSPAASVAIGKVMALDLSSWRYDLSRFQGDAVLPPRKRAALSPPYPPWGPTIVGEGRGAAPSAAGGAEPGGAEPGGPERETAEGRGPPPRAGTVGASGRARIPSPGREGWEPLAWLSRLGFAGSNAWAVAGVRSWIGQPLLANDMHLGLGAPSTWYLVGLHAEAEDLHVAGLSIPGVPGIVVGYNREIAWGFTNGMVDDMDFAVETPGLDGSAYRSEGTWTPFEVRQETIRVRGRRQPVVHRVRTTVRGPVVSDVLPGLGATLSVLWTGRQSRAGLEGLLDMNRAQDPVAFDRAVRSFAAAQQNVIYATARGVVGYRLSGLVPRRRGWGAGKPASHQTVGRGWDGFWPPDSLPSLSNPSGGFVASANNLQAPGLHGILGVDYPVPFRARRIVDRLEGELAWTKDLMRQLQLDTRSGFAERVGHRAIAAADRIGRDSVAASLAAWNQRADVDSPEATVFYLWLYRLRNLIAGDEWAGHQEWAFFPDGALLRILEAGDSPWVDDVGTEAVETLSALEERAMREALDAAAGRAWGEIHREVSVHPLGRSAWLDRIFGFNVGPHPSPGGPHTVRPDDPFRWSALDSTAWTPPLVNDYGPSERFVAELRPGRSLGHFLLPTGQSGNPFSRHYRDMAARWTDAALLPVPIYRDEVRRAAERVLTLEPE